jgi:TetR/AcrR family transcriptional regulator, fatty acid metabolism regulator protein
LWDRGSIPGGFVPTTILHIFDHTIYNLTMRPKNSPVDQETHSFIEAARRAQIIESAIETIATLGFAKASLAQIAKHAGISKGVISYHFAGKDELIEQVVMQIYTAGAYFMGPKMEAESTPTGRLRAYIESNVAYMQAYPQRIMALVEIFVNFRTKEGKPRFGAEDNESVLAPLEEMLRWGQETGEFRDFSTRVMAMTIRGAIDSIPAQMIMAPNLDLEAIARELVILFDVATRKA